MTDTRRDTIHRQARHLGQAIGARASAGYRYQDRPLCGPCAHDLLALMAQDGQLLDPRLATHQHQPIAVNLHTLAPLAECQDCGHLIETDAHRARAARLARTCSRLARESATWADELRETGGPIPVRVTVRAAHPLGPVPALVID